jgi:parallel beta-helix repeat protein
MAIKMKKRIILVMFLIILFFVNNVTGILLSKDTSHNQLESSAEDYDIIIPDDYYTIQEGINAAYPEDKILVRSGHYKEHLYIDTEGILIQGQDKYNTIIDGQKTIEDGIIIDAKNVTFQGFTVTNADYEKITYWNQSGLVIYSSNCVIRDNIFLKNQLGVHVYTLAYNLTISDNIFIEDGILLADYFNSPDSPKTTVKDYLHDISNNTVNGQPIYYFVDKHDFVAPKDSGILILVNCTNATIQDLYMSNNDFSIFLAHCSNCLIENNTIEDTDGEILLEFCENITIQHNIIRNTLKAVCIEIGSKNNLVQYNDISENFVGLSIFTGAKNNTYRYNEVYDNEMSGIEIVSYHNGTQQRNTIEGNDIHDNKCGIHLRQKSIKNNIINNSLTKNLIGIFLEDHSNDNNIESNIIVKSVIGAVFLGCDENNWNNNYWGRPRILPKMIPGLKKAGGLYIPWANTDKNPKLSK